MREMDDERLVEEAVAYLKPRLPFAPAVGIVLGSGLGAYADRSPIQFSEEYAAIPGFPSCSIEGHRGRFVLTERCGVRVAILQGRAHRYEGFSLCEVTRPIRVLARLGVETLVLTGAAGGLADIPAGDVMGIEDHLNLMGENPLMKLAPSQPGSPGFVEMADAYDPRLMDLAQEVGKEVGIRVRRGVLACVSGPSYETAAEAAMLRRLGAHAVSMSTVPEVIVARALGLRVLALAVFTNRAGIATSRAETHREVVTVARGKARIVEMLVDGILGRLASDLRS